MLSEQLQKAGEIFGSKNLTQGWQDKQPRARLGSASVQPATAESHAVGNKGGLATATATADEYTAATPPVVDRRAQHGTEKRQTAQVTGRLAHHLKARLLEVAKGNGWTESKIVGVACQAYLEQDLGEKFGVRLAKQLTEAQHRELATHSNREAYLTVQGYYAAEESRIINTKVLSYLFGSDTEIYKQIVEQARKEARENIRRHIEEK
jgi:hypothetical protein